MGMTCNNNHILVYIYTVYTSYRSTGGLSTTHTLHDETLERKESCGGVCMGEGGGWMEAARLVGGGSDLADPCIGFAFLLGMPTRRA